MHKLLIGLFAFLVISCDKTDSHISYLEGTYIGYHHRNNLDTQEITIHFNTNSFISESGSSSNQEQCSGSFDQRDSVILFYDSCSRMSRFKPFIILKGKFHYAYGKDGAIRLWKETGSVTDEYILRRSYKEYAWDKGIP